MASTADRGFWSQAKTSMARALIPNAMLAILMLFLSVVLIRIVFTDTTIPTVSTDVEAAARSNERMLQMVQWSLAAVMGLGLALIGMNWFTTTRDRAEIAELEQALESTITDYRARLSALDNRISRLDLAMWPHERSAMAEEILTRYWQMPDDQRNYPQMCATVFRESHDDPKRKRAAAEVLISVPWRHVKNENRPATADYHDTIVATQRDLMEFDSDLGQKAMYIIARDLELLLTVPESERPQYQSNLVAPPSD